MIVTYTIEFVSNFPSVDVSHLKLHLIYINLKAHLTYRRKNLAECMADRASMILPSMPLAAVTTSDSNFISKASKFLISLAMADRPSSPNL